MSDTISHVHGVQKNVTLCRALANQSVTFFVGQSVVRSVSKFNEFPQKYILHRCIFRDYALEIVYVAQYNVTDFFQECLLQTSSDLT